MAITLKLNKSRLIPSRKMMVDIIFITISVLIVRFILDITGIQEYILRFIPPAYNIIVIVGLGVYLKKIFDVTFYGNTIL